MRFATSQSKPFPLGGTVSNPSKDRLETRILAAALNGPEANLIFNELRPEHFTGVRKAAFETARGLWDKHGCCPDFTLVSIQIGRTPEGVELKRSEEWQNAFGWNDLSTDCPPSRAVSGYVELLKRWDAPAKAAKPMKKARS